MLSSAQGWTLSLFEKKYRVFEVDYPLTQEDKLERISRAGWTIPQNLTFVPVDFGKDNLVERLPAGGFDKSAKSFSSWPGVTYYLSAEAPDAMLAALSDLCADGSTLVFDYPDGPIAAYSYSIVCPKINGLYRLISPIGYHVSVGRFFLSPLLKPESAST